MAFPSLPDFSPLLKAQAILRNWWLQVKLPILSIHWFQNLERISGGLLSLNFDAQSAIKNLQQNFPKAPLPTDPTARAILTANCQWNIVWSEYELATMSQDPTQLWHLSALWMIRSLWNGVNNNTNVLTKLGAKPITPSTFSLVKSTNKVGADVVYGDLVGNTYTDSIWATLINGLDQFTTFRQQYTDLTHGKPLPSGSDAGIIAKAIALSEIAWVIQLFSFRNGLSYFESAWKAGFRNSLLETFFVAANLAGAGLPNITSAQIIKRISTHPKLPIEQAIQD